jgi:PAS domain S-box-containing protein
MESKKILPLIWIFFLLTAASAYCQVKVHDRLIVDRAVLKLGENTGTVIEDQDGFLWFGTNGSGLFRYDGISIKSFKTGLDSISDNYIFALFEDSEGIIWIGTRNGLNAYNKQTGKITIFRHDPNDSNSLSHDAFAWGSRSIWESSTGDIWIGTMKGLNRYDKGDKKFTRYLHNPNDPHSLGHDIVYAGLEDSNGIIWVATLGGGLNRFNKIENNFKRLTHDPNDASSISDNSVMSLIEDKDGEIWAGTLAGGLNRLIKSSGTFTRYINDPADPNSISHNNVFSIYEDRSGRFWFCRYDVSPFGLEMFDKSTGTFHVYHHDPNDPTSLSSDLIFGVFEDQSGILWVINLMESIDKIDRNRPKFSTFKHKPNAKESISGNAVVRVYEDREKNIWAGPFGSGLSKLENASGKWINYLPDPKSPLGMARYVPGIFEDSSGQFWLGNFGGTLSLFDRKKGRIIKTYSHDPKNPNSLVKHSQLNQINEDTKSPNYLWLGAYDAGLVRFNKIDETFVRYNLTANQMWMFYQDHDGIIWIPTLGGGLDRFDPENEKLTNYKHSKGDLNSISSNSLNYVYADKSSNILWIGGTAGIDKFEKSSGRVVKRYTRAGGFDIEGVMTIVGDDENNLWIGTDSGLIKFNPRTESLKIYTEKDGLPGNRFNFMGAVKSRDERLWFGTYGGILTFHPNEIKNSDYRPPIVLTSLKQGGESMALNTTTEKLRHIVLDWSHNYFEFEYAALNYTQPEKCQYQYMLEGYDTEWFFAGTKRFGRYTNLPGGIYSLKIKGSNNDGVWNDKPLKIKVTVHAPFWKTGRFYLILILGFFGFLGFCIFYFLKLRLEIRDRKRAEASLQERNKFVDKIIDSSALSTWISDEVGTAIRVNPACLEFFGATEEEILGKYNLYKDSVIEEKGFMPIVQDVFEKGKPASIIIDYNFGDVNHLEVKDATHKVINSILTPILDDMGKVSNVIVQTIDLTEITKAEDDKIRAQKHAAEQEKNALVGQIAGKIAHDFNNILGAVMGNAELALIDCRDEEIRSTLELIFEQTIRGRNLTRNLVAFAKDQEPKQEFFKISEKIDLVVRLLKKDLEGIDIIRQDQPGVPDLLADPGMIEHSLVNLMQNAIHALSNTTNPKIILRTNCVDNNICIEIEDNGCGIPKEHIDSIYEPAFTLKGSTDSSGSYDVAIKGTGYGMTNVKKYIELHNGHISVESRQGVRTRFDILLPIIKKSLTEEEKMVIQRSHSISEKYILLVEDEIAISDIQYRILTQPPCHHKVDIANNGKVAMDLFGRSKYDIVSLDYSLPGKINGMDVYHNIREQNKIIPILFISGNIEFLESIKELKRQDQFIAHLSKPCQNKDYVKWINKLLEKSSIVQ